MRPGKPILHDPELGPVKECTGCGEWWPADAEFYPIYADGRPFPMCKACRDERYNDGRGRPPLLLDPAVVRNREAARRSRERRRAA